MKELTTDDLHPSPEELVRFVDDGAAPWVTEQIRQHLDDCAPCRELAADLASYPELEPPSDDFRIDETERRRALGALRNRILIEDVLASQQLPAQPAPRRDFAPARWGSFEAPRAWAFATAAALTLVVAGWWLHRQQHSGQLEALRQTLQARLDQTESELRRPLANVPLAVLLASDDPVRAEMPGIPAGTGALVILQTEEPMPTAKLSAEIRTLTGALALKIDGLVPAPAGITFFLPPSLLTPGAYTVRLVDASGETLPLSFELTISKQP